MILVGLVEVVLSPVAGVLFSLGEIVLREGDVGDVAGSL